MVVGLIWNIRGLNRPDKLPRVHELIRDSCPDLISFSESKIADFSVTLLQSIDYNIVFNWNWLPAVGTAGGILVGVQDSSFEIISWEIFKYCVVVIIKDKKAIALGDLFLFMALLMRSLRLNSLMSFTM
jgi:hypothetical protein